MNENVRAPSGSDARRQEEVIVSSALNGVSERIWVGDGPVNHRFDEYETCSRKPKRFDIFCSRQRGLLVLLPILLTYTVSNVYFFYGKMSLRLSGI